ncbi:uncharacterized protein F5891DRAFT_492471 [Suillus fuscotomentosus]|uniref:Uncharacterized protein n=1 Tax=Suillus fuscotomentosus TaxID=1912939 RepID=A0AAD4HHV7_9AGAM|nr:uncharacterized protein F5891DRAFT_492471 [Suillus fuscotomentosus]KAG1898230.1 hypothetical protein F5891DRAFT_492471 [Suillus fuscotomentosus]
MSSTTPIFISAHTCMSLGTLTFGPACAQTRNMIAHVETKNNINAAVEKYKRARRALEPWARRKCSPSWEIRWVQAHGPRTPSMSSAPIFIYAHSCTN